MENIQVNSTIDTTRFLDRLDNCFNKNDIRGAKDCKCFGVMKQENSVTKADF